MTKTSTPHILDRKESKVLRAIAKPADLKKISSKKIQDIISQMNQALDAQDDGVAIAAPQIGESLRIFIVSGRVGSMARKDGKKIEATAEEKPVKKPNTVYINPTITRLSKKKALMEEGCLSVRWLYGKVERSEKATIKAYDEHGVLFTKGASGLLAQAFQHEVDHLNGILFIDKAVEIEDHPPKPVSHESEPA